MRHKDILTLLQGIDILDFCNLLGMHLSRFNQSPLRTGIRRRRLRLSCEPLEDRVVPSTVFWDGGPNGTGTDWHVAENWLDDVVPGLTDDVVVSDTFADVTITSSADVEINSLTNGAHLKLSNGVFSVKSESTNAKLTLAGATLTGAGNFAITNSLSWISGDILTTETGQIKLTQSASGVLSSSLPKRLGRVLENLGVITYRGTKLQFGPTASTPGQINNRAGASFTVIGDGDFTPVLPGAHAFNNEGTLTRSGRAITTFAPGVDYNNLGGAINLSSGTLQIGGFGLSNGGTLTVSPGAVLDVSDHKLNGSFTGHGGGTILLTHSALTIATGGATFDFDSGMWQWTGGDLVGDTLTILDDFTIAGQSTKQLGLTLKNLGTVNYVGSDLRFGAPGFAGGVIDNLSIFNVIGDADFVVGENGIDAFHNFGTFNRSGAVRTIFGIGVQFNNNGGDIVVSEGILELGASGLSTDVSLSIGDGASVNLSGHSLSGLINGTGTGAVLIEDTVFIAGAGATFDLPGSMWQWLGGDLVGAPMTNNGQLTIGGVATKRLGLTLTNSGNIVYSGSGLQFGAATSLGVIDNEVGGSFEASGDGDFAATFSGNHAFINSGAFERSGSGTTTFIDGVGFNNLGGSVNVTSGTFETGPTGASTEAIIVVAPGAALDLSGHTISGLFTGTGGGNVIIDGNLFVSGAGATIAFVPGMAHWLSGDLVGASLTNTVDLTIAGDDPKRLGLTLNNPGAVSYTGTNLQFGPVSDAIGILNNAGTFQAVGDGDFSPVIAGSHTFNNTGTFRRSGGGATLFESGVAFKNISGTIEVVEGKFILGSTGVSTAATINAADGAVLDLSGHTVSGLFTGTGDGSIVIDGNLFVSGAGATFTFATGMAQWLSGDLVGASLTNTADFTITGDDPKRLGLTLNNSGIIHYTGTSFQFGPMTDAIGSLMNAGTFEAIGDGDISPLFTGAHDLTNVGTFRRSGSGATQFEAGVAFRNIGGVIEVLQGTVYVGSSASITGAMLNVAVGAALDLSGSQISANISAVSGGTVMIAGDITVTGPGAKLGAVPGMLQWSAGILSGSALTNLGAFAITGSESKTLGLTLENFGNVSYTGDNLLFGPGNNVGGVIFNRGAFQVMGDGDFALAHPGPHAFNNLGAMSRSGAGNTVFFPGVPFNLSGTIFVETGKFQLDSGGSASGSFSIDFGAIYVNGGTFVLQDGATSSGQGFLVLTGGTLRIDNDDSAVLARFIQRRGALAGTGTLRITEAISWGGGLWGDGGNVIISAGASGTLTGTASKYLARHLENSGTIIYSGSGLKLGFGGAAGTLHNLAEGVFTISDNGGFDNFQGVNNLVDNAGTLTITGLGVKAIASPIAFQNTGTVDVQNGILEIAAPYLQFAGHTILAPGTVLQSGGGVWIQGGLLSGSGTINGDLVNSAEIHVGTTGSWGTLTVMGNFTQTLTGVLYVDLAGATPGSYSELVVNGGVELDGTMNVGLLAGFSPTLGDTFQVLTFNSASNDFSTYQGLDLGNGLFLHPTYDATNLKLVTE